MVSKRLPQRGSSQHNQARKPTFSSLSLKAACFLLPSPGEWGSHFLAHLPCLLSILLDPVFPSPGKPPRGSGDQEDGDRPPVPLTLASRNVLVRQHHPATGEAVSCLMIKEIDEKDSLLLNDGPGAHPLPEGACS